MITNDGQVVVGDLHSRRVEPFYTSVKMFMDWYTESEYNRDNYTLVLLGDLIHFHNPEGDVDLLLNDFILNRVINSKIFILQGNHDIGYRNSGIRLLMADKRVSLIETPTTNRVDGLNLAWLPYYYSTNVNIPSMKEFYEHPPEEFKGDYDFVFGHVGDETQTLFQSYIDLSKSGINGKRKFGHVHHYDGKNYLGSPLITRYDEKGKDSYISFIQNGKDQDIKLPKFLDYADIKWDEMPKELGCPILWTVKEVPLGTSMAEVKEHFQFQDSDIYDVVYKEVEEAANNLVDLTGTTNKLTLLGQLEGFCNREKIEGELKNLLVEYVSKKMTDQAQDAINLEV